MKTDAERDATAHSCCGEHHHDQAISIASAESRQPRKKYFCPMCEGVESDTPGSCPKCGMALRAQSCFPRAEENHLHLPDASAD